MFFWVSSLQFITKRLWRFNKGTEQISIFCPTEYFSIFEMPCLPTTKTLTVYNLWLSVTFHVYSFLALFIFYFFFMNYPEGHTSFFKVHLHHFPLLSLYFLLSVITYSWRKKSNNCHWCRIFTGRRKFSLRTHKD